MSVATQVRERPILFNGEMVRAILDGRKTMTRRVVNPQPVLAIMEHRAREALDACRAGGLLPDGEPPRWQWRGTFALPWPRAIRSRCPYGAPGDRLWVRETWRGFQTERGSVVQYRASAEPDEWADANLGRWKPSIHMPRWASRITLEITDVRVERVQGISEEDARAEGIVDGGCLSCGYSEPCGCSDPRPDAREAFAWLWDRINGPRGFGWDADPWVWVLSFRRVEP